MVVALVRGQREAGPPEVGALGRGGGDHVVVEAGNLDASGARVVEVGDQLHELRDRIARRAAHVAGMGFALRGVQHEMEPDEPAQPRDGGRPPPIEPGRIRDHHRMRGLARGQPAQHRLQRRRSDLLLHLPQQADADGHSRLAGRPHPEEGGEGRALVVGGAASEVTPAAPDEAEGLRAPALRLAGGGLHVEMVVEDDGGPAARGGEVADDEGMAARAQHARAPARRAHETGGGGGAPAHVGPVRGVRGNRWNLDELAQRALVLGPGSFSKLIERGAAEGRHPRIMPGATRAARASRAPASRRCAHAAPCARRTCLERRWR